MYSVLGYLCISCDWMRKSSCVFYALASAQLWGSVLMFL